MVQKRLIYNNWIAEAGAADQFAPVWAEPSNCLPDDIRRRREVEDAVRRAVESLPQDNRELIIRYHFMGQSLTSISEATGRRGSKLAALLRRTHRMLRRKLIGVAGPGCRVPPDEVETCPICRSPHLAEINPLIRNRDPARTWKPVMAALREIYGIDVSAPQVLISHEKYHIT